jgi:hypothetical protein
MLSVFARTEGERGTKGISAFVVFADDAGFSIAERLPGLFRGDRRSPNWPGWRGLQNRFDRHSLFIPINRFSLLDQGSNHASERSRFLRQLIERLMILLEARSEFPFQTQVCGGLCSDQSCAMPVTGLIILDCFAQ